MNILEHATITFDAEYTERLNARIKEQFSSNSIRNATHLSDLYGCLLKGWGKHHIPESEWHHTEGEDDPLLMWGQGLQFEALVSEGQKQAVMAYCWECRAIAHPIRLPNGREQENCGVCGTRWLIGTPDYRVDGIIHESKQTRKSQRRGPMDAPWWIEQLAGYLLFERRRGSEATWGRIVANWLMGDYGEKRKNKRPKPPRSAVDGFRVQFPDDEEFWRSWEAELRRRQMIVDGKVQPELSFPGYEFIDSPRWVWECASCPVGKPLNCPNWMWDDNDDLIVQGEEAEVVHED